LTCALGALASIVVGCAGAAEESQTLTVFAASSLAEAFGELEAIFETTREGTDVRLAFAGSQTLRLQLEQGAAADVFVSANQVHVVALTAAGLLQQARPVTSNQLALVVPADNPANIRVLADLPRAQRLVIGTENVPIGAYTQELLANAAHLWGEEWRQQVLARVVSTESNVRLVRAKVELGEADAAIVYRTDASATSRVGVIPIPAEVNVSARYHAGIVAQSGRPLLARAWIDLLESAAGQAVLARRGFATD
jgi:molybdate transport system substrate-binding protein